MKVLPQIKQASSAAVKRSFTTSAKKYFVLKPVTIWHELNRELNL